MLAPKEQREHTCPWCLRTPCTYGRTAPEAWRIFYVCFALGVREIRRETARIDDRGEDTGDHLEPDHDICFGDLLTFTPEEISAHRERKRTPASRAKDADVPAGMVVVPELKVAP